MQRTLRTLERQRLGRCLGIAALAGVCLLAVLAASAQAAPADGSTDAFVLFAAPTVAGAGDCSSPANACLITTAVTDANAEPVDGSGRIELAKGIYHLTTPTPTALAVTFTGPSLTFDAESGTPILDGGRATRLMSTVVGSNVTINGLQFEFGSSTTNGGAIQDRGTLTVTNSMFSSNTGSSGGAIEVNANATLTVQDSTLSHNSTTGVGGGAILSSGTSTIERSEITDNTAPINGGAINVQVSGIVTVTSSTIAGNESGGLGGGVSNLGQLTVQASTISNNRGTAGSAIATGNSNAVLAADIIAEQASVNACNPADTITDGGYNLDDDGSCVSPTSPATGSHSGQEVDGSSTFGAVLDAYLAQGLADNGGPTRTLALLNSPSPATTLADPALAVVPASFNLPVAVGGASSVCSLSDQRGVAPAAGSNCDSGAYQLQPTQTALGASAQATQANASVTYTATVSPAPDGGTVSFNDGAGNPATLNCGAQRLSIGTGTATCTTSYPSPGAVPVTATYSGDGAENNFATSMSPTVTVTVVPAAPVPPAVSQLRFSPHTFNAAGRKVHGQCVKATQKNRRAAPCERALKLTTAYQLSVAGKVSFKLVRSRAGRKVHGHCVKATPANQQHAPCTLLSSIGTTVIRSGVTGANTFTFTGTLAPGTYRLTVIPAGGTGRTAHFRVTASRARPAPARRVRNIPRRDS